ncbi:lactate racemase domain-containing protein [Chloroflexota bacterium]
MKITIFAGDKEEVIDIPDENVNEVVIPTFKPALENIQEKIREAVLNPIGTKRLSEIIKEKFGKPGKRGGPYHKVAIAAGTAARPDKHYLLSPPVLEELERAGIKDEDIVIVGGGGVHQEASPAQWEMKWGKELYNRFKNQMYSHTAPPPEYEKLRSPVKFMGFTSHNVPVSINKYAAESDVLIALGSVTMNVSKGFGGGAKMIMPGIACYQGITLNHALTPVHMRHGGSLEHNAGRLDINESGDIAGLDFIVNAVHNTEGDVVAVAAGHHFEAWESLLPICREMYVRTGIKPAEIFISTGLRKGSSVGGGLGLGALSMVEAGKDATKPGGTMIFAHKAGPRSCVFAHESCPYRKVCEDAFHAMKPRPWNELIEYCYHTPRWERRLQVSVVSTVMNEKEIVITGEGYTAQDFEGTGFRYIPTLSEAVEYAFKKHGKNAKANISPYGRMYLDPNSPE